MNGWKLLSPANKLALLNPVENKFNEKILRNKYFVNLH